MMASPAQNSAKAFRQATALKPEGGGGVLSKLLHALNQPLTGLQCSMEVALAAPRTTEQYVQTMREGLELTARMRALAGAISEVVNEEGTQDSADEFEFSALLRQVVEELAPVAEARQIRMVCNVSLVSSQVKASRARMQTAMFRLTECALALAEVGSAVQISATTAFDDIRMQLSWNGVAAVSWSISEAGLLVAQAACERAGARWERNKTESLRSVTIWLPRLAGNGDL
jgi:signal transduction histidine kinase